MSESELKQSALPTPPVTDAPTPVAKPRGHKKAPVSAPLLQAPLADTVEAPTLPTPRKRGRPPKKHPTLTPPTPTPEAPPTSTADPGHPSPSTLSDTPPPAPKKRGRPPKKHLLTQTAEIEQAPADVPPVATPASASPVAPQVTHLDAPAGGASEQPAKAPASPAPPVLLQHATATVELPVEQKPLVAKDTPPDGFYPLTYQLVRQWARPGSWRRGYGYFQTRQVTLMATIRDGIYAEVKGRYKEGYHVRLYTLETPIRPQCDCPLEEPWCKHAIAVALEAMERGYWRKFWYEYAADTCPVELEPDEQLHTALQQAACQFIIELDVMRTDRHVGLRLIERATNQPVTSIDRYIRAIALLGASHMNDAERQEVKLLQWLHKEGFQPFQAGHRLHGWIEFPVQKLDALLRILSKHPLVVNVENGAPFHFYPLPLTLQLCVNASQAGNVMTSLHWLVPEAPDDYEWDEIFFDHHHDLEVLQEEDRIEEVYPVEAHHQVVENQGLKRPVIEEIPLETLHIFSKEVPWGLYRNTLYPLSVRLSMLPKHLVKSTFNDIRDADGGRFLFEELPKIQRLLYLDYSESLQEPKLYKRPPVNVLHLELMDPVSLRLRVSLSFSYDGVEAAFTRNAPESPYVMVYKQNPETIYWIRRDLRTEHHAYKQLEDMGLEPIQANFFQAEGDNAIDFYNEIMPRLDPKRWQMKITADAQAMALLKVSKYPLRLVAEIDFEREQVDTFRISLAARVGQHVLDLDQVQHYLLQGKKYFYLDGAGFVEVPLATVLQFGKTLQAFDAENVGIDTYRIQTFKAGLLTELIDQGVTLTMSPKFQQFWQVMSSNKPIEEIQAPANLNAELRHYQTQGFNWLLFLYNYGLNGILADDMGLGKTLQSIALLQHVKNEQGPMPSLIVAPTSVVFNWRNELARFAPDLNVVNLTGADRFEHYKKIKKADVVLTSYAILRRDIKALKKYPFRAVILDEAQNIKNAESQTALAAKELHAGHRLALSGTPIENHLAELWSIFDFLMPSFLYDRLAFRQKYVVPIEEKGNRDAERRLRKQVAPFLLRRLKQDVLDELPPKIESIIPCEMDDDQYDLYMRVLEEARSELLRDPSESGLKKAQAAIFRALIRLRQVCCHPMLLDPSVRGMVTTSGKFEALKEFVLDTIENGHRILLFSQFVEMLKIIRGWLDQEGVPYCYLTGETRNREAVVNEFNNNEKVPLFLVSLKAGGTGLNLTGADVVIHYDPWWNPAAEDQATDRAYRIGQTKTVFVYRMITQNSVEEKIIRMQSSKRDLVDSIISADRAALNKFLSLDNLKAILSTDF